MPDQLQAATRARLEEIRDHWAFTHGLTREHTVYDAYKDILVLLAAYDAQAARLAELEATLADERLQRRADIEREASDAR